MTFPICPCDDDVPAVPVNLPQLNHIAFRFGTYAAFRRAVLTPATGERSLDAWRPQGQGDLAVMMAEWFAYLGDILTFYDERIANQCYLRTADLDASVKRLISVLGYRPRPAIGATGVLAALVTPGQSAVLPRGLQIQSKPGPGQPPQTFELAADTPIGSPDQLSATTPPSLLVEIADFRYLYLSVGLEYAAPTRLELGQIRKTHVPHPRPIGAGGPAANYGLLLQGTVNTIDPGALLLLRPRDPAQGAPLAATVAQAVIQPAPGGGDQTCLALDLAGAPPAGLTAAQASLERNRQTIGLWGFYTGAISGDQVHLASLARQIRPGAWVLFTSPGVTPLLARVTAAADMIWDAGGDPAPGPPATPLPIPHTLLTLNVTPSAAWAALADQHAVTVLFDWISVGQLLDQPPGPWSGAPTALVAASATRFPPSADAQVLLQDQTGAGLLATASSAGDLNLQLGGLPAPTPPLQPPFSVLFNPLPVTRGKTVKGETLGSGDATRPDQSFTLAQSPVTYLQQGASVSSTIALTVGGEPWKEVASFYGQGADAQVFVTGEDVDGRTHVTFGDGVNGARLPTGASNVVATYRVGAGAASPPAGKLTVIAQAFPGLRSILNPVAVGGGADPDPPNQIRRYAPRSVLTFGRAVSVFDYEALAAQAPGVSRAQAVWAWNDARQRTLVTVYVGDDDAARSSAIAVLAAAGDPNRPVQVVQAAAISVTLNLTVIIIPGWDPATIIAQVTAALVDPETGLFSANLLAIGQPLFDSQIEQAVLATAGTVAIRASAFTAAGLADPGPLHSPGEGRYYALAADDVAIITEPDAHG